MGASLVGGGAGVTVNVDRTVAAGTHIENEPIIKSDGAGSVMQWDNSNADAGEGIYFVEGGSAGDPVRLGVGESSPDTLLHLKATAGADMLLQRTAGATTGYLGSIHFGAADGDEYLASIYGIQDGATDSGKLEFHTEPTSGDKAARMTISSAGLVGIGFAPSSELTVGKTDAPQIDLV